MNALTIGILVGAIGLTILGLTLIVLPTNYYYSIPVERRVHEIALVSTIVPGFLALLIAGFLYYIMCDAIRSIAPMNHKARFVGGWEDKKEA